MSSQVSLQNILSAFKIYKITLLENRVLDLELSSKEEKNLKDQLGSELSRVRSELRQVQKEFDKERDELKTKILDKDREVRYFKLLNF